MCIEYEEVERKALSWEGLPCNKKGPDGMVQGVGFDKVMTLRIRLLDELASTDLVTAMKCEDE